MGDLAAGGALLEAALAGRGRGPADLLPGGFLAAVDGVGHGEPLEDNDLGGHGGRVEEGDRAFAPEPAARLSGVDEKGPVPALSQGFVGMSEDDDVVSLGSEMPVDRGVEMADEETEAGVGEFQGRLPELAQPLEGLGQAGPLTVAVAEDRFDRGPEVAELIDGEGGDEVAGVDDQVAAGVVEKADSLADPGQVIVGIGEDADHGDFPDLL